VDSNGNPLWDQIRAHMTASGVKEPAFITQRPNERGAKNFNVRGERPVGIGGPRRTGEATRKGTFDAHPDTLVEGAARTQGLVDATDGFRNTIKEFAVRKVGTHKVQRFKTYNDAMQAAKDLTHDIHGDPIPGAHQLRPVKLNPPVGSKGATGQSARARRLVGSVDALRDP
jgi:hypothetical protein